MSERDLLINRIRNGTVLDHLESGSAFTVLAALDVSGSDGNQVSVAMNVPSRKVGKKDIIKVENRFLKVSETNRLALMAPRATVNIIRGYGVTAKRNVKLPKTFVNVLQCSNPTCITNSNEPIIPELRIIMKNPPMLQCKYCSRVFGAKEVIVVTR